MTTDFKSAACTDAAVPTEPNSALTREIQRIAHLSHERLVAEVAEMAANWVTEHQTNLDGDDGISGPQAIARAYRDSLQIATCLMAADDEWRGRIIDLRDVLCIRGVSATLSIHDQNLLRDCDIALGLVRCKHETREEAKIRVLREIHASATAESHPGYFTTRI